MQGAVVLCPWHNVGIQARNKDGSSPYANSIDLVLEAPHPNVVLSKNSLVFGILRPNEKAELSLWYKLNAPHPGIVRATPSSAFMSCRLSPETSGIVVAFDAHAMTDEDKHRQWFVDLTLEGDDVIRVPCIGGVLAK
jgi:hypothetical protein